jgi:hypothetical protein
MVLALFLDLSLVLALTVIGFLVSYLMARHLALLEALTLSFPIGAGLMTLLVFVFSWLGFPIALWSFLLLLAIVVTTLFYAFIRNRVWREIRIPPFRHAFFTQLKGHPWSIPIWLAIVGFFSLSILIAVGRSYSLWDGVAFWSVKGYGIVFGRSIFAAEEWGSHALTYPLNISLLIGFFRMVSGDVLPGLKLIFPIYYIATMLGIHEYWRRYGVPKRIAALGLLFLCVVPIVFYHATIGYTNLALSCYLLLGFFYSLRGTMREDKGLSSLGGLLFGLAAWTRVEGVMYCLVLISAVVLQKLITRRYKLNVISWMMPFAIVSGIWFVFMGLYGSDSHAVDVMRTWTVEGWRYIHIPALKAIGLYLGEHLFMPELWGIYFAVVGLFLVTGIRKVPPKENPVVFSSLIAAVALGMSTIAVFYIATYLFGVEFVEGWLRRGFPRHFLPATLMLGVVAILLEGEGFPTGVEIEQDQR